MFGRSSVKKARMLDHAGWYRTLSGSYANGHGRYLDRKQFKKMTEKQLEAFLSNRTTAAT